MTGYQARKTIGITRETLCRYVKSNQIRVSRKENGRYDYCESDVIRLATMKGKWRKSRKVAVDYSVAEQMASKLGYDIKALRSRTRTSFLADQRKVMARLLKDRGWSHTQIGEFLNRDHSSVTIMIQTSYLVEKELKTALKILTI